MINLTPIPKNIQKRLFEKMRILGRTESVIPNTPKNGGLTHDKLAIRTTFLRMTSGQTNAVVLMGGKLKDDLTIPGGYDGIYGPRRYKTGGMKGSGVEVLEFDEELNEEWVMDYGFGKTANTQLISNENKRPLPGVVSIDASFRGGVRALREATINWTCWDWNELELLTPHFLSHGKTVMVEWGWVYDDITLLKLPNFLVTDASGNRFISADAYTDYRNKIIDADGDFDMMVGVIKNFEFTTRDDGGFDCQTIISSVGASIIENPEPNKTIIDPTVTYGISTKDKEEEIKEKIENALADESVNDKLIRLNTSVTFKAFLSEIDNYLLTLLEEKDIYDDIPITVVGTKKNKFIVEASQDSNTIKTAITVGTVIGDYLYKPLNAWVRWGWFEDNILSKFLSLTSDDKDVPIVTEFRSVEKRITTDGKESKVYESTRIRNNNFLETVDINSYILPGQFYPLEKRILKDSKDNQVVLKGDTELIMHLYNVTKEAENFEPFSTGEETSTIKRIDADATIIETVQQDVYANLVAKNPQVIGKKEVEKQSIGNKLEDTTGGGKYGYLRNMLINTAMIRDAFGVNEEKGKIEATSITEGIQQLFSKINGAGGLNFWNFELAVDETDTHRCKIIDSSTTYIDFNKPLKEQRTNVNASGEINKDEGIFFFPVWQSNSLVKRQNVTAKIPSAMQLAIMYGSNVDALKGFGKQGSVYEPEAVAAGGLYNDSADKSKEGLDIAIKNDKSKNIGLKSGDSTKKLSLDEGENVFDYLSDPFVNRRLLESYELTVDEINESIAKAKEASKNKTLEDMFDPSLPPPTPDFLTDDEILEFLDPNSKLYTELETDKARAQSAKRARKELIEEYETMFGQKFLKKKMKKEFLTFVNKVVSQYGASNTDTLPLLIPLDLELDIDGIGGIYPGNSFNSTYVPFKYQKYTVFQAFDVNHSLDSSGWTTTILGKMRSTLGTVYAKSIPLSFSNLLENYREKVKTQARVTHKEVQEKPKPAVGGPCWIASEIYGGWYTPRTTLVRKYVNSNQFPKVLYNLYMKYGERTSKVIKKHKFLKLIFKSIFDIFVKKGKKLNG